VTRRWARGPRCPGGRRGAGRGRPRPAAVVRGVACRVRAAASETPPSYGTPPGEPAGWCPAPTTSNPGAGR
jgi:hypothetical protein